MADSESQQVTDTTQQVTSQTPATKPKNPKRVAAGKATAEKNKKAREAQKKAYIDAQIAKQASPPPVSSAGQPADESTKNVLTTTQWLSVISIVVSLAGIYYKREEIKGLLTKPHTPPPLTTPPVPPNSPVVPRRGIQPMD